MAECPYNIEGLPQIRTGAAQVCITPPVGAALAGYFHERISEAVRDDLFCRALVIESAGQRIALVSCDLIAVSRDITDPAKAMIQERTGIAPDNVLICATHTHTGPEVRIGRVCSVHDEWVDTLPGLIADAVTAAAADTFDAILFPGREDEHQLGNIRLGRKKDASEVFSKTDVIGPAREIDPEVLSVLIRDHDGNVRAVIVNYANHGDVIGGGSATEISADWFGVIADTMAAVYGKQAITVFLNGACGDINQHSWQATRNPQRGPAKATQIGRAIAGLAISAGEKAEPLESGECGALLRVVDIPYYTRDEKMAKEVEELRKRDKLSDTEQFVAEVFENWPYDNQMAKVTLQVLRLGDMLFIGLPGEIFNDWGKEIKHWSPAKFTFIAELANDWFGYVPTTDQAQRGAYGAKPILSRRWDADGGRQMADHVQVMMYDLWDAADE